MMGWRLAAAGAAVLVAAAWAPLRLRVADDARLAALADLLVGLRLAHAARYPSRIARQRYRGESKKYSVCEAKHYLGKPLPPTDRAIHEWPPVAFYVPRAGATLREEVGAAYEAARALVGPPTPAARLRASASAGVVGA